MNHSPSGDNPSQIEADDKSMTIEHGVTSPPFEALDDLLRTRPSLILHGLNRSEFIANELALRFLSGTDQLFWWEKLKVPYAFRETSSFDDFLNRLRALFPDPSEALFLFPTDENWPPWMLFEGTRDDIEFVMGESRSSEFMIARRPLDVIVFETHHNLMIVAGSNERILMRLRPTFSLHGSTRGHELIALRNELNRDRRAARRNFRASLMSNAKWWTLLEVVRAAELDIQQVVIKFVDIEDEKLMWLPIPRTRDFADSLELGPFPFVDIEWFEFPHVALLSRGKDVPPRKHRQDVAAIRSALEATGKRFPLTDSPTGLRVLGHVGR
jgi:hypothetical protein